MFIVFGILFIPIGVWMMFDPDMFLRWEDFFRVKGERTYSDFAISAMRVRGVVVIIGGVVLFFFGISGL